MLNDLRYAFRQLIQSPTFTIVAILTIALGIGSNTTIFSVVNGVLISPLPFPNADRLTVLYQALPDFKDGSISYPNFLDWQRMNASFFALASYRPADYNFSDKIEPEHLRGEMISAGFFDMLGVQPILGRSFTAEEDHRGTEPVAMISEGLWRREFGASPSILGHRMVLDGAGYTIVGVVPSSFHLRLENFQDGAASNDVYTPVGQYDDPAFYADRNAGWGLKALGLLKTGVSVNTAREDMARVSRELTARYPAANSNTRASVVPLREDMVGDRRSPLLILLGAVFFVLLISCVNVSNLLLARSTAREHEFAIRIALGGGQWRIIRQLLTESLLLAVAGGFVGLFLAQWGTALALANLPRTLPQSEAIQLDFRCCAFTAALSLLAGATFGLAPALKLRHANLAGAMREVGRSVARSRHRTQQIFVVTEIALALILLVGAGLMVRTLFALWRTDPGFNPQGVMSLYITPPAFLSKASPEAIRTFWRKLHDDLISVPGVQSASLSSASSPMRDDYDFHFWFVGRPKPEHFGEMPMSLVYVVEPDYLKTLQISIKTGRFFTSADTKLAPPVAVIDESLANRYFPHQNPLGQYLDLDTKSDPTAAHPKPQIVGIIRHLNQWGLADNTRPLHAEIFLPLDQMPDHDTTMGQGLEAFVRGDGATTPDFNTIRRKLETQNAKLVAYDGQPLEQIALNSIADRRFSMTLLGVFAGIALLLASIGIYGVLSYAVGQRVREIGIRIALGAARGDVLRMILADGGRTTAIGVALGVVGALSLTRLMAGMLFGVQPTDLLTFGGVILVLSFTALIACYAPAHRAMKVDPLIALRNE